MSEHTSPVTSDDPAGVESRAPIAGRLDSIRFGDRDVEVEHDPNLTPLHGSRTSCTTIAKPKRSRTDRRRERSRQRADLAELLVDDLTGAFSAAAKLLLAEEPELARPILAGLLRIVIVLHYEIRAGKLAGDSGNEQKILALLRQMGVISRQQMRGLRGFLTGHVAGSADDLMRVAGELWAGLPWADFHAHGGTNE